MAAYSRERIDAHIASGMDKSLTTKQRGDALEDLFCYLLGELSGIFVQRNSRDPFHSMELDIVVANLGEARWMQLFPNLFIVECKNWDEKVGSPGVSELVTKLEERSIELGVLVAASGTTGDQALLTAAYHRIAMAQQKNRRVIVLTLEEIKKVDSTEDFTALLRDALMKVVGSGKF